MLIFFMRRFNTTFPIMLFISLVIVANQQMDFKKYFTDPHILEIKSSYYLRKPQQEKTFNTTYRNDNYIWAQHQLQRIKHFREKCHMHVLDEKSRIPTSYFIDVLYSEKYKLAYRTIPKIGSTFMKQVMFVLSNVETDHIFKLMRSDVHKKIKKSKISKRFNVENLDDYLVLIMTRNPYSRIYSAYVDKVYILSSVPLCVDIVSKLFIRNNRTGSCKFDISFEDFLEYLLHIDNKVVSSHYDPIMSQSYSKLVCNLKNIAIVKQETFAEDIDHVLKAVSVRGKLYDVIYDEMNTKHTVSTIRSIVETIYKKLSSYIQKRSCLSWKEVAIRLWKSFQIQGYIHSNSTFPQNMFDNKRGYHTLYDVIMKELQERPLKHKDQVHQRNTALLRAYADVDNKYMRKIREVYALDFDMFQYETHINHSY